MKIYYLYCLRFPNGKKYFGISHNPGRRFNDHCATAQRTSRFPINRAIRLHGRPQLSRVCAGDKDYIKALEIKAIAAFRTCDRALGYNASPGGDLSFTGPEARAKMSAAKKGKPSLRRGMVMSPESRAKISASKKGRSPAPNKGIPRSAETRAKLSAAQTGKPSPTKGKKASPETLARMRANSHLRGKPGLFRGRKHSPESRAKMSAALKGRTQSAETRAKRGAALKGRPGWNKGGKVSPEVIEKIRAGNSGKKRSPEHKANMRAAAIGRKRPPPFSAEHRAKLSAVTKARWARARAASSFSPTPQQRNIST